MTTTVCSRLLLCNRNRKQCKSLAGIIINSLIQLLITCIPLLGRSLDLKPLEYAELDLDEEDIFWATRTSASIIIIVFILNLEPRLLSPWCLTRVQSAKISLMCGMSTSFVEREKLRCVGPSWVFSSAVFLEVDSADPSYEMAVRC